MSDTEASLDGFRYAGLRFTDSTDGLVVTDEATGQHVTLGIHHQQVLRAVLDGNLMPHEVDES